VLKLKRVLWWSFIGVISQIIQGSPQMDAPYICMSHALWKGRIQWHSLMNLTLFAFCGKKNFICILREKKELKSICVYLWSSVTIQRKQYMKGKKSKFTLVNITCKPSSTCHFIFFVKHFAVRIQISGIMVYKDKLYVGYPEFHSTLLQMNPKVNRLYLSMYF